MAKVWEIDTHTFPIVWVLFFHQIPILWHTSSYGKCMGFPINFSQYRKMQQNPSYEVNLGNWYSHFSHSMGDFSPYNFHPMVYFIIWEMHGFPHQFPILQENATKLIVVQRTWEIGAHTFPILWMLFFSIRFPFYGILHHMGNACVFSLISHNMGKDSQNHRMGKVWEIGSRKYPTKPIACGEPGKLVLILFPQYGCFFPIRFTFYGILYNM